MRVKRLRKRLSSLYSCLSLGFTKPAPGLVAWRVVLDPHESEDVEEDEEGMEDRRNEGRRLLRECIKDWILVLGEEG